MHAAILILAGLVVVGGFGGFVLMFFRKPPDPKRHTPISNDSQLGNW